MSKIPSSRNVIGILTALLWVAAGVYMTLRGVNSTWKLVGYGVIAVGVWRGFMLLQHWDRYQEMTAPLRRSERPLSHDDDEDDEDDNEDDDDLHGVNDEDDVDDDAVDDVDDEDDIDDDADEGDGRIDDGDETDGRQNKG